MLGLAAGDFAQVAPKFAQAKRHADSVFRKWLARWTKHARTGLQATRSKRNVRSDDDVACAGMSGNPVVRHVRAFCHRHVFYQRVSAWPEPAIADDVNHQVVAGSDAFDLALHRTGIAVDENLKQEFSSSHSP